MDGNHYVDTPALQTSVVSNFYTNKEGFDYREPFRHLLMEYFRKNTVKKLINLFFFHKRLVKIFPKQSNAYQASLNFSQQRNRYWKGIMMWLVYFYRVPYPLQFEVSDSNSRHLYWSLQPKFINYLFSWGCYRRQPDFAITL